MPAGPRIRANNSYGLTTDAPLTIGATTFNSAGLVTLPTVAAAHAVVTLDPLREFGEPEIVVVTAHTSAATVATIVRGQYATVARSHPVNTTWVHAPLDEDFVEILTAATRPSNPYEGQFIFEIDTNKLVGYGGVDWAPRDAGGQLGYAQKTATDQTGITTIADLTGLTVTCTVGTGRRVRINGVVHFRQQTANGLLIMEIREGSTTLQQHLETVVSGQFHTGQCTYAASPSAGTHIYKLSVSTSAGTVDTAYATTRPALILVEDIGAA